MKARVFDYLLITGFGWGMYLIWLIPFQIFWVKLDWNQFFDWLIFGTILELFFTYPIMKTMNRVGPKITTWCNSQSDNSRNSDLGGGHN